MTIAESKLTSQSQISVPVAIRKKLGLTPGSTIEWVENEQGEITVKRASKVSFDDMHQLLFDSPPERRSVEQMNEAITAHLKKRFQTK